MERLQSALQDNKTLVQFKEPIRLPVDPHIQVTMATWMYLIILLLKVTGIIAEEATLFKSALMPARFNFRTKSGGSYSVSIYV